MNCKPRYLDDDAAIRLASGIVRQAKDDYMMSLRDIQTHPNNEQAKEHIRSLERFFRSAWFGVLTCGIDGEAFMLKLRKKVV